MLTSPALREAIMREARADIEREIARNARVSAASRTRRRRTNRVIAASMALLAGLAHRFGRRQPRPTAPGAR